MAAKKADGKPAAAGKGNAPKKASAKPAKAAPVAASKPKQAKQAAQPTQAEAVKKGPHDARNKADAQAAAKASGAPPAVTGGVSSGGGPAGNIDMEKLKPGQFSKLSKDQQAALLGGVDAL